MEIVEEEVVKADIPIPPGAIYVSDPSLIQELAEIIKKNEKINLGIAREHASVLSNNFAKFYYFGNNLKHVGYHESEENHKFFNKFFFTSLGITTILKYQSILDLSYAVGIDEIKTPEISDDELAFMQKAFRIIEQKNAANTKSLRS